MAPKKSLADHGAVHLKNLNGHIYVGGSHAGLDAQLVKSFNIRHVVCCCAETADQPWPDTTRLCKRHLCPLPVEDENSEDPPAGGYEAWCEGLEAAVAAVEQAVHKGQAVLVHDMLGLERAVAVCVAWAAEHKGLSAEAATERVSKQMKNLPVLHAPRLHEFIERFTAEKAKLKQEQEEERARLKREQEEERARLKQEEEARKAAKRRIDEATGSLAKRAKKDPMLAKAYQVGLALADPEQFPSDDDSTDAREMLLAGLSFALGKPKAERHVYQETIAAQVGEVLKGIERKLAAVAAQAKAAVEGGAPEAVKRCTREQQEAVAAVEAAKEDVVARGKDVTAAHEAVLDADFAKREATSALRKIKKHQESLDKEKVRLEGLIEGPLKTLVEGTWETEKELQKLIGTIRVAASKVGAEDSIVTSMPHAFATKPPRAPFDQIIVDQLKELFGGKLASFNEEMAAAPGDVAEAERKLAEAEQLLEGRNGDAGAAQERLDAAHASQAERSQKSAEAENALKDAEHTLASSGAMKEKADAELASFVETLKGYQEVLEWTTPEPEEAAPAGES